MDSFACAGQWPQNLEKTIQNGEIDLWKDRKTRLKVVKASEEEDILVVINYGLVDEVKNLILPESFLESHDDFDYSPNVRRFFINRKDGETIKMLANEITKREYVKWSEYKEPISEFQFHIFGDNWK